MKIIKKVHFNDDLCYVLNKCCKIKGYAYRLGYLHKSTVNYNQANFEVLNNDDTRHHLPRIIFERKILLPKGYYAIIKVEVAILDNPYEEKCWTDMTLFLPTGVKIGCSEPNDKFTGIYHIQSEDLSYLLEISEE